MSTADKLNALVQTKADIKQALIDKGQNPSDVFSTYADDIRAIETGSAGLNWEAIGYESEPNNIIDGYNYALELMEEYKTIQYPSNFRNKFYQNKNIVFLPNFDWAKIGSTYSGWTSACLMKDNINLQFVDKLDFSKTYSINNGGTEITDNEYFNPTRGLFTNCTALQQVNQIKLVEGDAVRSEDEGNCQEMFKDCKSLKRVCEIIGKVRNMEDMFYGCVSLIELPDLDVSQVQSFESALYNCSSIKNLDLTSWNISNGKTLNYLFSGCSQLESLDISSWDFSNAESIQGLFYNCKNLTNLTLPDKFGFPVLDAVFYGCKKIPSSIIQQIDFSKVTSLKNTFVDCDFESLDFSFTNINTITDLSDTFNYCKKLKYLDISTIDTSVVTKFGSIFGSCEKLLKVKGCLDYTNFTGTDFSYYQLFGYIYSVPIRCLTLKNLGIQQDKTNLQQFVYCINWGIPDETIDYTSDARETLINTLITYSFDRVSAGYESATVRLSNNTKALLTENEIAQITAKGFTIA